ncbi:MAG: Asp-tRNA(Asn)/Glu-tRNA(Gln) amidotransferase subunit GatA [Pirellulales bacterium]
MDTTKLPLKEVKTQLASGKLTSQALVDAFLSQIERQNATWNILNRVEAESARAAAHASDQRRAAGKPKSAWDGIPYVLKDILCTKGTTTSCGSRYLEHFVPPYQATVVERLDDAGLVRLGKANLDEFAMGGSTETSIFGPARNPWNPTRTTGGSSGGSAASIAARFAPWSIGTDTGGSIRQPAAYCGVCGLKPTYGRLSRYGLVAYASSLDTVGVFGRTVEELAELYCVVAGHDPRDSTSIQLPPPRLNLHDTRSNLRVGVARQHLDHEGLDPEIRQAIASAIEQFRAMGAEIVDVELPLAEYAVPAYYIIAPSEASSNLSRFDGAHYGYRSPKHSESQSQSSPLIDMYCRSRGEGFGTEVKRRIMLGTYALSSGYYDAYYLKALRVRRLIRQDYDKVFAKVDVLLGPTTPGPAFTIGEKVSDPVQMYLEDWYTVGANLAGIPAISIPCGKTAEGLPIGMQLQAAPLCEEALLQIAHRYQTHTEYTPEFPS